MKTDYTVLARTRNAENVWGLVRGIEEKGYTCYNFLHQPVAPELAHLPSKEQIEHLESHPDFWNDPTHRNIFENDLEGLKNAKIAIMLLPAGKAAHMESGVAFGLGKRLILIGEVEKPETLYLMFEERYPDIESFLDSLSHKTNEEI